MSESHVFQAKERAQVGTGTARAVRRDGMVPGVVYGDKKEPQAISINSRDLEREFTSLAFFSRIYTIDTGKEKQQVIAKDIQLHPVTDVPLHIDFQRINKNSKVHVSVPVHYINEEKSPGIKRGGTLNVIVHSLEIVCSPLSIPEELVVDLAGLEAGKSITLDVLSLPQGVNAVNAVRDNVLATIVGSSTDAASEEA
jgi:large subunit ribosomal protein L25